MAERVGKGGEGYQSGLAVAEDDRTPKVVVAGQGNLSEGTARSAETLRNELNTI